MKRLISLLIGIVLVGYVFSSGVVIPTLSTWIAAATGQSLAASQGWAMAIFLAGLVALAILLFLNQRR